MNNRTSDPLKTHAINVFPRIILSLPLFSMFFLYNFYIIINKRNKKKRKKYIRLSIWCYWKCQNRAFRVYKYEYYYYYTFWGFFECCLRGRVHDGRMASMLFRAELPYACWMYISLYLIWVWGMEFMYIITIIIASGIVENFVLPNVTRIFRKYLLYQYYIILFTLNRSIYFHSVYADVVLCHMPCICCHIVAWNFCSLKLCWICSA